MSPPWSGKTPRSWQAEALPIALDSIRLRERGVVTAIMGSGKSILISEVCASGRGRVLVTAPTIALVDQLSETIAARCPSEVGRYYTHAKEATSRITVACLDSVPALVADPNWPGHPALMIADECHKTESETLLSAYEILKPERILGFTATPFRSDEKQSLSLFDREIYHYGVAEAIRDGVVVPFRQIPWQGADCVPLDEACLEMVRSLRQSNYGVFPGLCNAVSIEDAETFAEQLTAHGLHASAIHSKLPRDRIKATLERLRTGEIFAAVHVNMLSEGIDLPWLRWLLMRRPVGSRVRFCQEVGRVLRAAPGKNEALLLDPHDLLGRFALSYEAILGEVAAEEKEPFEEEILAINTADGDSALPMESPKNATHSPKKLAAWRKYLRALTLTAMARGLLENRVASTRWRPYPVSEKQIKTVSFAVRGIARDTSIPKPHRVMLVTISEQASHLTKGDASDLLGLLFLFKEWRVRKENLWDILSAVIMEEQ